MRLVCPNCSSQYEVDIALFPEEGREVQCSNCEEIWVQHPVDQDPPLRLDDASVASPVEEPRPARPSQRLKDDEQRELAAAVQQEIAAREGRTEPTEERPRSRRRVERSEDPVPEDEILSQLRAQIEKEGGDFEGDGPTKSQKRNLAKAAESAGIAVGDRHDDVGQRGALSADDGDVGEDKPRRARRRREKKPKPDKRAGSGGLAAALREIETAEHRQGMGFRHGFLTAAIIAMIGSGVYMFQKEIVTSYPPAAPWLEEYDRLVNLGRAEAERLYAQYRPVVEDMVDQAGTMIADLTGGDENSAR